MFISHGSHWKARINLLIIYVLFIRYPRHHHVPVIGTCHSPTIHHSSLINTVCDLRGKEWSYSSTGLATFLLFFWLKTDSHSELCNCVMA